MSKEADGIVYNSDVVAKSLDILDDSNRELVEAGLQIQYALNILRNVKGKEKIKQLEASIGNINPHKYVYLGLDTLGETISNMKKSVSSIEQYLEDSSKEYPTIDPVTKFKQLEVQFPINEQPTSGAPQTTPEGEQPTSPPSQPQEPQPPSEPEQKDPGAQQQQQPPEPQPPSQPPEPQPPQPSQNPTQSYGEQPQPPSPPSQPPEPEPPTEPQPPETTPTTTTGLSTMNTPNWNTPVINPTDTTTSQIDAQKAARTKTLGIAGGVAGTAAAVGVTSAIMYTHNKKNKQEEDEVIENPIEQEQLEKKEQSMQNYDVRNNQVIYQ